MRPTVFGIFILSTLFVLLNIFYGVKFHFNGTDQLEARVASLSRQLEEEKLRLAISKSDSYSFKNFVATLMPAEKEIEKSYPMRTLASLIVGSSQNIKVEPAGSLFDRGREFFRKNDFQRAALIFQRIMSLYPDSTYSLESRFLLVESLYQIDKWDEAVKVTDEMVSLFPEHELTGFALLRVGSVMQRRNRIEDAAEIFMTVRNSFANQVLKDQANSLLKEIEL